MHPHITKLHNICAKPSRLIIGLMSGTSLDGLDIALCKISGHGKKSECDLIDFLTLDYCDEYRANIRKVFSKEFGSIEQVCLLNAWIGRYHAKMVNQALKTMGYSHQQIDALASHGQTIYHCPVEQHKIDGFGNATLQIGDGDHIAVDTNIITLSDFRQKHIAGGGQGAPLVMYGDYLLFHSEQENRIMLNIGGIANLTLLPSAGDIDDILCSDIGPGNTMMDAYIQAHFAPMQYDKNAEVARKGKVNHALLNELLTSSFLQQNFPKTTGPEVFNLAYLTNAQKTAKCQDLSNYDIMATLCEFTARCIASSICSLGKDLSNLHIYCSGGGIHNPLLMTRIKALLEGDISEFTIDDTQALMLNPDAKEAVLFALLANQTLCADDIEQKHTRANMPQISMGKISFPD